jgi:hypothetical protein
VVLGRAVEVAEQQPCFCPGGAPVRIDDHLLHPGEVEHDPPVADGVAGEAVASAADGQREVVLAGEEDAAGSIHPVPSLPLAAATPRPAARMRRDWEAARIERGRGHPRQPRHRPKSSSTPAARVTKEIESS